jgi:RNA polymerase sigma-70 factor (ECF subfamily)
VAEDETPLPGRPQNVSPPEADAHLLAQLRDGDVEAGYRFVRDYYPAVYRYLLYLTGHRETAEDLAQETFLLAWRHLEQFQGRAPLRLWLHQIARREFLHTRRRRRVSISLDAVAELPDAHAGDWTDDAELRVLLHKLPEEQREVMILHDLEGYSSSEIARIIGMPASTVRYHLGAARAHLAEGLGQGDLVYLNEPSVPMRQWAWLPLDQMYALEARLSLGGARRRTPEAGKRAAPEDRRTLEEAMERREFLRHAAVGAAGLMLPEAEKDVIDSRLTQKATLAFKGTALSDVCERLRSEIGVHLAAGPSVADEKVTLFCKQVPLRDVMRQLSRPFGYTWLRSGTAGEYRYELVQDLRSQLLEEELRNRDRNAALLALEKEIERYRPYLDLSPDEALARAQNARPEERRLLETMAGKGWGPIQIYFRLSPQESAALRAGQTLTFHAAPEHNSHRVSGELPLPPDVSRGVLQSHREWRIARRDGQFECDTEDKLSEGLPPISVPEAQAKVILQMRQSELGQFTINDSSAGFTTPNSSSLTSGFPIAVGMSPAVEHPKNAITNARLAHDPALRPRVSVRPQHSCQLPSALSPTNGQEKEGEFSQARCTTADVLEAVHQATDLPIVADYYTWLYESGAVTIQDRPLFDALNELADAVHVRWTKDGSWLQFRSASFYDDRLKEVPNRLLARWAASRRVHAALTLDDLIEISLLPDAQLDARRMAEGAKECWGLTEWDLARSEKLRSHLRFLAGLTPGQRQEAVSATGLAFHHLSLAQQQPFITLSASAFADVRSLEELTMAALYMDYTVPGWWQWYAPGDLIGPDWPSFRPARVRERTRESALRAARQIDPKVDEAQIVPTKLDATFTYMRRDADTLRAYRVNPNSYWGRNMTTR